MIIFLKAVSKPVKTKVLNTGWNIIYAFLVFIDYIYILFRYDIYIYGSLYVYLYM